MRPTETEDKGILFMMNWSKSPSEIKSFCGQPGSAELISNLPNELPTITLPPFLLLWGLLKSMIVMERLF